MQLLTLKQSNFIAKLQRMFTRSVWINIGDTVYNAETGQIGILASEPMTSPDYNEELQGIQRVYVVGNGWADYWLPEHTGLFQRQSAQQVTVGAS